MKKYIEKEAAIRNICKGCGIFDTDNCICTGKVRCDEYDAILDTPPADVKPVVRGEWVKVDSDLYWCSHCHSEIEMRDIYIVECRYCPVCGAEMRKEGETDENAKRI